MTSSTSTPPTSPKPVAPLVELPTLPKLRHIAPAPRDKPEYDIYHIPKGFEVVLVPKPSNGTSSDFSTGPSPTSPTSTAIPLSPAASVSSIHGSPSKLSPPTVKSPPNSSWRKRKNNGHIPRPKNCFMAYREHMQHEVLKKNPGMNNKHVSIIAAEMWKNEPEDVKQYWRARAQQLKLEHMAKYPNYKFSPKKKQSKSSNNNGLNGIKQENNSKIIKRSTIMTDGYSKDLLKNRETRVSPLFWGHYRSSSSDSIGSWTSDSTPSTPPSFIDDSAHSPPMFNSHQDHNRSPSPLRYEACLKVESNNLDQQHEWQRICDMPLEGEFFQTLLPPMEFDQHMHVEAPYYDSIECGSFLQHDAQLLNSFEFNPAVTMIIG
ncbi:15989_t:CDS:2 [Cetraspora pellucida]|uniref:15989_t:CDS:1 n=1 Tax=Cetraspora pellucida TaxID=1433469 RepID=A0A9N9CNG5_9GLOM|nr:15989_t:CDS:2 [Cetraspora pellucida]